MYGNLREGGSQDTKAARLSETSNPKHIHEEPPAGPTAERTLPAPGRNLNRSLVLLRVPQRGLDARAVTDRRRSLITLTRYGW